MKTDLPHTYSILHICGVLICSLYLRSRSTPRTYGSLGIRGPGEASALGYHLDIGFYECTEVMIWVLKSVLSFVFCFGRHRNRLGRFESNLKHFLIVSLNVISRRVSRRVMLMSNVVSSWVPALSSRDLTKPQLPSIPFLTSSTPLPLVYIIHTKLCGVSKLSSGHPGRIHLTLLHRVLFGHGAIVRLRPIQ